MGQQFHELIARRLLSRRKFLIGAGATAAALGSPLYLSNMVQAAPAVPGSTPLPPPILFPGTGIGAQFNAYAPPPAPWTTGLTADTFDRCYFPGQKAQLTLSVTNPGGPPPAPWLSTDIGSVGAPGSVYYGNGQFTINGSGADIWTAPDSFYYVYQPLAGDGTIVAHVVSVKNTDGNAKAGVMIRETLDASASFFHMNITPGFGAAAQWRIGSNGPNNGQGPIVSAPYWVKLVRAGDTFTGSISPDGTTWTVISTATISMAQNVFVGLAVCAHSNGAINTSVIDNVSVNGVLTSGNGNVNALTINGNIVVAFSTEVIGDTNGGVQLTPVEVVQTVAVPTTVIQPGTTFTQSFTYDASDPNTRKGVYAIYVTLEDPTSTKPAITTWLGNVGVIYPPTPGFKPNSFFMADIGPTDVPTMEAEARTSQKVGVKWTRTGVGWDAQEPQKGTYDWTLGDQALAVLKEHELYTIWLTLSSPDWARDGVTYPARTGSGEPDLAIPDSHLADYQQYWVDFIKHYQGSVIKAINVWNEPWEGGGISGWGGTGQTYRHMIKAVHDGVKSVDPTMLVGGDDSDDNINDILYCVPEWPQLFDLATQHGGGANGYYMQKLLPFPIWNTESWYFAQSGQIVQETLFAIAGGRAKINNFILGNFFSGADDAGGGGYSYDPKNQLSPQPSAITYSTMAHFLEDTAFVKEPHPDRNPFVFLFKGHNKNVAVLFGFPTDPTWVAQWQIKGKGTMRLPDPARQVSAYDAYGNPYKREADGSYVLPFDVTPTFVTGPSIDALTHITDNIVVTATATPVTIVVDDITSPLENVGNVNDRAILTVTVINTLHQDLSGSVQVTLPSGWSADTTSFTFSKLAPSNKQPFHCRLTAASYNDLNQYPVTVTVTTPVGSVTWQENVEVHVIAYGTPTIGQGLAQDEWKRLGVHPILIGKTTDPAYAQVGLSYDENNLYFIAAVNSPDINPSVDQNGTWYTLIPPGYGYADGPHWPFDSDNVQLGINCYENEEDYLYPKDDPYHYRYPSRETDYLFGFYWPTGTNGQVWRYRIPGFPWRHRYPFTPFENMRQIVDPDVKLTVTHTGNWYIYWATLPLSLLTKLQAHPDNVVKLAVKHSNSHVGDVYSSQGRSSSRIDVQAFQPYWAGAYSIDTLWGFGERPKQ